MGAASLPGASSSSFLSSSSASRGLGTFVSDDGAARSREVKRRQAETLLGEALREGAEAGLSDEELLGMVEQLLQEMED